MSYPHPSYPGASRYPYPHVVGPSELDAYYVRRPAPTDVDFEQAYWGVITDPDGTVRDRRTERERSLEDTAEEISMIESFPGKRILDVGCGLGFLLSGLSDRWEKHGLELSKFAVDFARREYGVDAVQETLAEMIARGGVEPFDVVVLYHVIEHVNDPVGLMKDIASVLRPGGRLVLGTPDFDGEMARRYGRRYRMLNDKTHVSLFTQESMYRMLRDLGWSIERVSHPYFQTRYFTEANLLKVRDANADVSPAWPGNLMTFYCTR